MQARMIQSQKDLVEEKEQELLKLLAELQKLELEKEKRKAGLKNLMGKWDTGGLYNTNYDRENIVDVHGDMSAANNFKNSLYKEPEKPKPKPAPAPATIPAPKAEPTVREVNDITFKPPSWAFAEKEKVVTRETVAETGLVSLDSAKKGISSEKEVKKEWEVKEKGNVSSIVGKWAAMADEETRLLKEKEEKLKAEKERKAKEAEQLAKKQALEAEEAAKKQALETEKLAAEAEKMALEAASKEKSADAVARLEKMAKDAGIPPNEPKDPQECLAYLEKKKDFLDKEIKATQNKLRNFV